MLTKHQFAKRNPGLTPVERAAAWKSYLAENDIATGSPTGTALLEQQQSSAAGVARSQREQRRVESRLQIDYDAIHTALVARGWLLAKESASGSRYYERDGSHVRVSDHDANGATQAWMELVVCREITRVSQVALLD